MIDTAKKCCHCGVVKPFAAFSKDGRNKSGLKGRCRECAKLWHVAAKSVDPGYHCEAIESYEPMPSSDDVRVWCQSVDYREFQAGWVPLVLGAHMMEDNTRTIALMLAAVKRRYAKEGKAVGIGR